MDGIVTVRLQMTCQTPVEFAYYASSFGRHDVCSHCGESGAEKDQELSRQYRVVLPVCTECTRQNKEIPRRNPLK